MPRWTKLARLALLLVATLRLVMQFDTGSIGGVITDDRDPLAYASIEARNLMARMGNRRSMGVVRLETFGLDGIRKVAQRPAPS